MAFARHDHSGREVVNILPDLDDLADEFVAYHHRHRDRLLGPFVPFVDVEIGAADRRPLHLDLDVVDAGLGLRNVLQPEATRGFFFDESLHNCPAPVRRMRLMRV
jgi:hypothetical protein